jgi:hypothetical protein
MSLPLVVVAFLLLALAVLWVKTLDEIKNTPFKNKRTGQWWFAFVFFTFVTGAVIYTFFGRPGHEPSSKN